MADLPVKVVVKTRAKSIFVRLDFANYPEVCLPRAMICHGDKIQEGERDLILDVGTMLYAEIMQVVERMKTDQRGRKAFEIQRMIWEEREQGAG